MLCKNESLDVVLNFSINVQNLHFAPHLIFYLQKRLCPSSCNDIRHFWALNEFDFPQNALCNVALTLSKFSGKCWMTDPEDIEFRRIFHSHSLQFGEVPTNKMNYFQLF